MTNDDLERLTDVELHRKLIENGFPSVPVTETTRSILIKKLRNHIQNEANRKKQSRTSSYAVRTSQLGNSFERPAPVAALSRRPISPTAASYVSDSGHDWSTADNFNNRRISTSNNSFVSGSMAAASSSSPRSFDGPRKSTLILPPLYQSTALTSKVYVPPSPILASESEEESDYLNYSSGRINVRRSDCSLDSGKFSPGNGHDIYNPHVGVVSRLLSFRDLAIRKQPTDDVDARYQMSKLCHNRARNTPTTPRTVLGHLISPFETQSGVKQTLIPYALLCAFGIFFVVLAFIYMIRSPDVQSAIHENSTQFILCGESNDHTATVLARGARSCIESDKLNDAIELNKELFRLLQERAEKHHCSDKSQSAKVSAVEFVRFLYKNGGPADMKRTLRNLQAAEYLIALNPQWKISMENKDGLPIANSEIETVAANPDTYFVLLKPQLPRMCVLYNKVQRFFLVIGTGTLIAAVSMFIYFAYHYIRGWQSSRMAAVDNFSTDIVNELMYRASISEDPGEREVVVNHLRDKLIPLSKRKAQMWAWNEALRLLKANDSRIMFGVSTRNGDMFHTMKWVGHVQAETRDTRGCTKQWQSPAFDKTNKIANPPTPCLKIRHMFDASEVHLPNLKQIIEEAILFKVGARCKIYDIQIDKESCCVYVRCASEEDAGIMHNEINGWWFDNRLVSIKFLRLQRYFSRFPKSSTNLISSPRSNTNTKNPPSPQGFGKDDRNSTTDDRSNEERHGLYGTL